MAINNKKITERTSYFGANTDNKYETDIKGISSAINNVSATTDRSYIPGANPPIEEVSQGFRLIFSDINAVNAIVGDSSNVTDWNTFFGLPLNGNPFTSVVINGNEVNLIGGSNIILREYLFDYDGNASLLEFNDQVGCVIESEDLVFGGWDYSACSNLTTLILPAIITAKSFQELSSLTLFEAPLLEGFYGTNGKGLRQCSSLTTVNLPQLTTAPSECFDSCTSLTTINLPSCINLGPTVTDDSVFNNIYGNTITLTIPSALMTCNSGNPDGDIQYLQANNTVTVVTV